MPTEFELAVEIFPVLETTTAPAALPLPPLPPRLLVKAAPPLVRLSAPLMPPLPPEPATDWAKMPSAFMPDVLILPVLVTCTSPDVAPVPPVPPIAIEILPADDSVVSVPETATPPLPPLPPSDWAKMPFD